MNGDIRPPRRRPVAPSPELPQPVPAELPKPAVAPAPEPPIAPRPPLTPKQRRFRLVHWILIGVAALLVISAAGAYGWYQWSLQRDTGKTCVSVVTDVVIKSGMTPEQIGAMLEEAGYIRSSLGFVMYTRLAGAQSDLQSGTYQMGNCAYSVPEIVEMLTKGKASELKITFYPGATLRDPTNTPSAKRTDVYTMLQRAGYSESEIEAALSAEYTHPLFVSKPAGTSLEGYVYGETYQFAAGTSAQDALKHTFDVYYQQLKDHNIIDRAKQRGLTLYEAITLASIIEREVQSPADRRQVAQIFYLRLKRNISLGADATFVYAARQQNKTPTIDFESPYNTRLHAGLPPGPIASPSLTALEAVADPAAGDYLYFVSGDDGKTYFAHTEAQHQANIEKHCQKLCYQ